MRGIRFTVGEFVLHVWLVCDKQFKLLAGFLSRRDTTPCILSLFYVLCEYFAADLDSDSLSVATVTLSAP